MRLQPPGGVEKGGGGPTDPRSKVSIKNLSLPPGPPRETLRQPHEIEARSSAVRFCSGHRLGFTVRSAQPGEGRSASVRAEMLQSVVPQRVAADGDRLGADSAAWRWRRKRGGLGAGCRLWLRRDGAEGGPQKGGIEVLFFLSRKY